MVSQSCGWNRRPRPSARVARTSRIARHPGHGTGAAVVLVGPASPAQAIPVCKSGYQCTYTYYSSATFETVVGGRTKFCDGTVDSFGTTTRWLEMVSAQCPEPL
ncbi:DUF6289 family protein [Micromonospora sp. NPDC050417]|uniref:DUF6289 family protein n=1 Tax=Micromonospora sp. NPDC050417 TaxID=3364280 RepID=UPI0037BB060E